MSLSARKDEDMNEFIIRPLRENFNAALNGKVEEILLSSLPNCTVASIGVSNILRRFSAVPRIGRSMARVILGLGGIVLGVRSRDRGALCVGTDNRNRVATNSVRRNTSMRVLGPSLRVTCLSRNTRIVVRVATSDNENCIPYSHGGRLVSLPVNAVTISSVCAPILGIGCAIRGAHINRRASLSGLILSIRASKAVPTSRTTSLTTGVLGSRLGLFISLSRRINGRRVVIRGSRSNGRGILRVAVRRLSLSIHSFGYLGETNVGAMRSLVKGSRRSVVGIEGLNHGDLSRIIGGLTSLNFSLDRRSSWEERFLYRMPRG